MVEQNVYQKLAEARLKLRQTSMKKTGYNTFSKYYYFELGDFLNPMIDIFEELGLISIISFGVDIATLTVVDKENPSEQIVITSPMSTAKLKACHEVQNLGAVQTYLRRYLYIALMEMLEHDACEASNGVDKPKETPPTPPPKTTQAQKPSGPTLREVYKGVDTPITDHDVKVLCTKITSKGRKVEDFNKWMLEKYSIDSKKKIPKMLYFEILDIVEAM